MAVAALDRGRQDSDMEARMDALKRITDLFVEGKELVLRDEPDAILVWVNKLNSFDQEEARRDGQVAKARFTLAMAEDSPERQLYESEISNQNVEGMRTMLATDKTADWYLEASRELRVDKEWIEPISILERGSEGLPESEVKVVESLGAKYSEEIEKRVAAKRTDYLHDLDRFDLAGLQEEHRKLWLENVGLSAFSREYQKSQVYYAMRTCVATRRKETGEWDHDQCDHSVRQCPSRDRVTTLPSDLISEVLTMLREISVQRDDARFMAGAESSSAPSPVPSAEEASTPSTPEPTSSELATTSA